MERDNENTLNALLTSAKSGDAAAFETLLDAYAPLIESLVSSFVKTDADLDERDDLRQEACIAFCNAVEHYDIEQKALFGVFAKVCVRNRLISYERKKQQRPHTVSLESEAGTSSLSDPAQSMMEAEDYLSLCRRMEEILSPYENRIWRLYLSGLTAKEIAVQLSKDERSVQNAIYRIRKKLRSALPSP